ncbi:FMN-dependent dehydrogenase-domain-containing protein [Daldinia decipiens]|uniref:FMN-dependent dehydrogenase-domain-containing protein n=1 Tax=Daldinia decipiens TaxID=326647 RepID=UPI0020C2E12F|nr:FMN-dependent dehydrogenase-domain-containing protein [Daldinia decipiens]KAI1661143.1 FMN-dependent dehydrogenase-domain-containing protein [Daldinia decipiens]
MRLRSQRICARTSENPGGVSVLLDYAGRDATAAYSEVHSPSLIKISLPASSRIGVLDQTTITDKWAKPPAAHSRYPRLWMRQHAPGLPIALKGIQTAADAMKAMEAGVDAIYISNHGERSLDTSPTTILMLLEIQKCYPQVFDKMEVYVDDGITRGTDIFKALCLGAKAVGIGRGFLFSLNYGKQVLVDELVTTIQMCGITSLDQVHPGLLHTGAVDHLVPGSEEHPYARWKPK